MGLPVIDTCFFSLNAWSERKISVRDGMSSSDSQEQKELSRIME